MEYNTTYKPGDSIGGRYRVHKVLAGGMGEVYLCLDFETDAPYALKTIQKRFWSNMSARTAFEREVETWVRLEKHPNIVRCFFLQVIDDRPFIFLEWVSGEIGHGSDLRSWLKFGRISQQVLLGLMIDVCRGLIHSKQKCPGMVHCDLKPDNILVGQGAVAKITDFGLAKVVKQVDFDADNLTDINRLHLSSMVGTPPYMAPEQWLGNELDERTDIYAIGCILFEMLTGHPPFSGSIEQLCSAHLFAPIPSLNFLNASPVMLETVIERCLAKVREDRFPSLETLSSELENLYEQIFAQQYPRILLVEGLTAADLNNRGMTYSHLGKHEEALLNLNQAIQLDPCFALAYCNRGGTYYDLGFYEKALEDIKCALTIAPNMAPAYYNRGNINCRLKRYNAALADLTFALQLDPHNSYAYTDRGAVYIELGQFELALADLDSAISIDPQYWLAYNNRGNVYAHFGHLDRALLEYSHSLELNPDYSEAYCNRGTTYADLGRYEDAMYDLNRAIQLAPHNATNRANRGSLLAELGQHESAFIDLAEAVRLDPSNAMAHFNLGSLYATTNNLEKALLSFEKAAQLGDPDAQESARRIQQVLNNRRQTNEIN